MANADQRAKRWAALNRMRELRSAAYAEHVAFIDRDQHLVALGLWLLGIGGLLALGLVLLLVFGGSPGLVVLALAPGILLVIGILTLVSQRRAAREQAAYDARAADRERWRRTVEQLADRWHGSVSVGTVGAATEFLIEHWPDPAPQAFVTPLRGERADRVVVVARAQDHPVLVEVVDTGPAGGFVPPVVLALLARPIKPPPDVLATPGRAGLRLADQGVDFGWSEAGVWARHNGPADAVVTVRGLDRLVQALIEISDAVPAGEPVPGPAPTTWAVPGGRDQLVEYFLSALRDDDLYAALACADTRMGVGLTFELTPERLGAAVGGTRPSSWRRTSVTSGGAATYRFEATMPSRRSSGSIEVHVVEEAGRWWVCGYQVDDKLRCGIAHEWTD